jgi:hypothetical protein
MLSSNIPPKCGKVLCRSPAQPNTAVTAVTRYSSSNEQTNFLNVEDSLSQGQRQLFYQSLPL